MYSKLGTDDLWTELPSQNPDALGKLQSGVCSNDVQRDSCLGAQTFSLRIRFGTTEICGQDTRWPVWEKMFELQFQIAAWLKNNPMQAAASSFFGNLASQEHVRHVRVEIYIISCLAGFGQGLKQNQANSRWVSQEIRGCRRI